MVAGWHPISPQRSRKHRGHTATPAASIKSLLGCIPIDTERGKSHSDCIPWKRESFSPLSPPKESNGKMNSLGEKTCEKHFHWRLWNASTMAGNLVWPRSAVLPCWHGRWLYRTNMKKSIWSLPGFHQVQADLSSHVKSCQTRKPPDLAMFDWKSVGDTLIPLNCLICRAIQEFSQRTMLPIRLLPGNGGSVSNERFICSRNWEMIGCTMPWGRKIEPRSEQFNDTGHHSVVWFYSDNEGVDHP